MIKYPRFNNLYARGTEGVQGLIVDGMDIFVVWDGHSVKFRTLFYGITERRQIPGRLMERLNELFGGSENERIFEQLFGENQAILYGEGYGGSIQKGGKYRDAPDFILFNVYIPEKDIWPTRDSVMDIAKALKLKVSVVPIMRSDILDDRAVDFQ